MKKAFYLFISILLVLFSTNKVNNARTIKRSNEQTNKQEIILIYSSNDPTSDIYTVNKTQGSQTARGEISSTFKISTHRRYILAMRTLKPDLPMHENVMVFLMGFSGLSTTMSGEEIYNYNQTNSPQYYNYLNEYFNTSSQEGGYFTYYLNLSSFGNDNNIQEMYMSVMQQGSTLDANDFIQDIFVYDITYITTQGETWYNYQSGADPAEIQTAYDKGYSDAIKSGTGLNWLQSAFNMITNILNIELLPNIKLAYLVAIPLLIELILFVLRFIK